MTSTLESRSNEIAQESGRFTVVLVDDHQSIREMLGFLLRQEGSFDVVGEASSGTDGLAKCTKLRPQLVILDLLLPELSGVEVIRQLTAADAGIRMLIYSGTANEELIAAAMRQRPHGFVHKEDTLQVFRNAIRTVSNGGRYFSSVAVQALETSGLSPSGKAQLTGRERTLLQLIVEGCSNKQAADRMGTAVKTVEHHRSSLMHKLGLRDVPALTKFAIRHGIISLD